MPALSNTGASGSPAVAGEAAFGSGGRMCRSCAVFPRQPSLQRLGQGLWGNRLGDVVVHAASRQSSRSPCRAWAVIAMMGIPCCWTARRGSPDVARGFEAVHLGHLYVMSTRS